MADDTAKITGPTMSPTGGVAGIQSTGWDGNFSTNYGMKKNNRDVSHIHYGEEEMDCPDCGGMGC